MKTKFNIRVGRFRLTEAFTERMLGYYSRRVKRGEMPNQITSNALDGRFTESVEDKLRYMVGSIGKLDETDAPGERETHAAYCAAADYFGLPAPAMPKFEDEQQQPQGGGQGQPKQSKGKKQKGQKQDDGGESGDGSDSDKGQSEKSEQSKSEKGNGSDGEQSEGEQESSDGESDGEGNGDTDGDGDGDADGESESDGSGSEGDGDGAESDGESDVGESGDGESDSDGDGQSEEEGENEGNGGGSGRGGASGESHLAETPHELDLERDVKGLMNYHEGPEPKIEPHPLQPITANQRGGITSTPHRFDFAGTNQLLARVREELMSVSRHRKYRDKDNGHVDTDTKLVDLATGNNLDRAFYTQTNARRLNTAVQIYVDISGSMNDAPDLMSTACAVSYLLADTLEKLRVPVEVIAYDGDAFIVKQWHEKVQNTPIMQLKPCGGTNLPNAQASGLKSLMARRERRKVQFIITDGNVGWPRAETFRVAARQFKHTVATYEKYASDFEKQGKTVEAEQYRAYAKNYAQTAKQNEDCAIEHDKLGPIQRRLNCPNLECYGFGIGVEVPSSLFKKAVPNLTPKNMVEVIVETLGHALHGVE